MKLLGSLWLACLILAGCDQPELITAEVTRGPLVIDVESRGEMAAVRSQAIARPRKGWSQGQIVRMVDEGTVVTEGDFLVQFDTTEADRRLSEKQNAYENALAGLASARASAASRMAELESAKLSQEYSYEQSKIRFEQMQYEAEVRRKEQELELRKAELSLQEANDRIASQRVIDEANIRKAEIAVQQAKTEVDRAQEAVDAQTLTAPIDGLVVYKTIWKMGSQGKVAVGDQPWPGQELFEIPDLSAMMVRTKVNEVDIHRVAVDQECEVEVDALEGLKLRGKVSRIATLAQQDEDADTKSFDVEVVVEDGDERLRPGMTALCRIILDRLEDVVTVPLEAVFEDEGRTICWVVDGGPQAREVTLGARNRDFVVVEEGLEPGTRISLRDPNSAVDEEMGDGEVEGAPGPGASPAASNGGTSGRSGRPRRGRRG